MTNCVRPWRARARINDAPAGALSAGQRRRIALARLAAVNRPLWLLDEPAAALDAEGAALLDTLIEAHRAEGGMVIVAAHTEFSGAAPHHLHLGENA
ncbi:MAG: ABC transporter ATP-binding protein [Rhodospirillales bacterium]